MGGFVPAMMTRLSPLLVVAFAGVASAQLIVRTDAIIPGVRSFDGRTVPVTITPITPSRDVLFAIATDYCGNDELERIKRNIEDLWVASKQTYAIRIALIRDGKSEVAGPFASRQKLKAALAEIAVTEPIAGLAPARFYSTLAAAIGPGNGDWATVVLAGTLPQIEPKLRDYATALLLRRFIAGRWRFSYWNTGGVKLETLAPVVLRTGGEVTSLEGFAATADVTSIALAAWESIAVTRGFHLFRLELGESVSVPYLATAPDFPLPDIAAWGTIAESVARAKAALGVADIDRARSELQAALLLNPLDPEGLQTAADLYYHAKDYRQSAHFLEMLVELRPVDPTLPAAIAHRYYAAGELEPSEKAHLRARQLKFKSAEASEELARIHLAKKDVAGAIPYLAETLEQTPRNQTLWFLRADLHRQLGDSENEATSLEAAVELGGDVLEKRAVLTRLLLDRKETARAAKQVDASIGSLPARADSQVVWAEYLEELSRADDALPLWTKAAALDPKLEKAHYSIARTYAGKKDWPKVLVVSEAGLHAAPKSTRILLYRAEAQEQLGQINEARRTIRTFRPDTPELGWLRRIATFEDLYGGDAPAAYQKLADAPGIGNGRKAALERGLKVSIRDEDSTRTSWFAEQLEKAGNREFAGLARQSRTKATDEIEISGGLEALSTMARGKPGSTPDRFMAEYARAIINQTTPANSKAIQDFHNLIADYFQRQSTLQSLAGGKPSLRLGWGDKGSRQVTEKVLAMLGWKLRNSKGKITIESGEKAAQAKKQDFAVALQLDQTEMEKAFSEGRMYAIPLLVEKAPIILTEKIWREQFYPKEQLPGGLAEAMAKNLNLARVYLGLSGLSAATRDALVAGFGLKNLAEKHADKLRFFSTSLAVENGRVSVPGGQNAETVWAKLAGETPRQPPAFFRALIEKNNGSLLAYYSMIAQLDMQHQRFFTATPQRTARFYELLRESPEAQRGLTRNATNTSFSEFLREVPLDGDGSVGFPGSPEIWMIAKGKSSAERTTKLLKKAHRKVAPDVEDEILARLASTTYKTNGIKNSELDNFLAVVRIEQHREAGLDEASALLLAQNYGEDRDIYPYFARITKLTYSDFSLFFQLAEKYRAQRPSDVAGTVAHFTALLELLRLTVESGATDQDSAAKLFHGLCDRFLRAATPDGVATTSIEWLKELVPTGTNAGEKLLAAILGRRGRAEWTMDEGADANPNAQMAVELGKDREEAYARVLADQKVPGWDVLFQIADAAAALAANPDNGVAQLDAIDSAVAKIAAVNLPKEMKAEPEMKNAVRQFLPDKLQRTAASMRQKLGRGKKVNPKDAAKFQVDLMAELEPQLQLAAEGAVYAYYFRPQDIAVADDALFLRKHRAIPPSAGVRSPVFAPSRFELGANGSYLSGAFADMATAAAKAALPGVQAGGGNSSDLTAAQIASVRSTNWQFFGDREQRLFGLRIRAAREWIVEAATNPAMRAGVAENSTGILSMQRHRSLLEGIDRHDWQAVWQAVTLGDLYSLAVLLPEPTVESDVFSARRKMEAAMPNANLEALGQNLPGNLGCSHPHLTVLPPYEDYERQMFAARISERASELKLYLAERLERGGVPASFLGAIAEPVALRVLRGVSMTDIHDWSSAIQAYSKIRDLPVEEMVQGAMSKR